MLNTNAFAYDKPDNGKLMLPKKSETIWQEKFILYICYCSVLFNIPVLFVQINSHGKKKSRN